MADQRCLNPRRLAALRAHNLRLEALGASEGYLNAIDDVVVSADASVPAPLRQRILWIECEREVGDLTREMVRVGGGARIRELAATWAGSAAALVAASVGEQPYASFDHPSQRSWLRAAAEALPTDARGRWLVVVLAAYGDFSTYALSLVTPEAEAVEDEQPAPGFDPILNRVEFSFKVECPGEFDCEARAPDCPLEAEVPVDIDYLARDFTSLRQLMLDRLARTLGGNDPDNDPNNDRSDDRNIASLRTTIVEALAAAGDQLSYYQDAVATEAYLRTARQRVSVRRHARLLDYAIGEGANARAFVQLEVEGESELGLELGVGFVTRLPGVSVGAIVSEAELAQRSAVEAAHFEVLEPLRRLDESCNELHFHTWGDASCCLARGATSATLTLAPGAPAESFSTGAGARLEPGDFLLLEQTVDPETRLELDADPERRHVVRIIATRRREDPLASVPLVEVRWHEQDALPFALTVSRDELRTAVARANVVLVDHGRSHSDDSELGLRGFGLARASADSQTEPRITIGRIEQRGLTWAAPHEPFVGAGWTSATAGGRGDLDTIRPDTIRPDTIRPDTIRPDTIRPDTIRPDTIRPCIELRGDETRWDAQTSLLSSSPADHHFVVEMDNHQRAWLRFGDGRNGRRPSELASFCADYRLGSGPAGNVGAEAIAHLIGDARVDAEVAAIVRGVRNPLPARGGTAPESLAEIKLAAPQAFRRQERAVTREDWIELARRNPRVQQADAAIRWTGSWFTVAVVVDPLGRVGLDDELREELQRELDGYRLAGYELEIEAPRYVSLDIAMIVDVECDADRDAVERELRRELGVERLGAGRLGFFHPDNFSFAQPVYLSQLVARAQAVAGVQAVDFRARPGREPRFKRWGQADADELRRGRIEISRLEIARCDSDPNFPDNGSLRLYMEGGA